MENKILIVGKIEFVNVHDKKNICHLYQKNTKFICHFQDKLFEEVKSALISGKIITINGYIGKKNIVEIEKITKNDN